MVNFAFWILPVLGVFVSAITPDPPQGRWVDTWASMPQLTEINPDNRPPAPFTRFTNTTVRQTLRISTPAKQIRLRFSNAFGTINLPITSATIALALNGTGSSAIDTSTLQTVTFSGSPSIVIPNGALGVSDVIELGEQAQATTVISVTVYLREGQQSDSITSHPGSRTTSWFALGEHVGEGDLKGLQGLTGVEHWYFLSAVEAWSPRETKALVIIGDSLTDGRGSTTNGNDRWTDQLLTRVQATTATSNIAVINQAAGGNRILADGLGPNVFGRIERDVLSHSGVGYAMIFEGTNDIGTATSNTSAVADQVIQAYKQISTRIHTFGIPFFGATITPFFGNVYYSTDHEAARTKVNEWIRGEGLTSGVFDAVVDFDLAVRDPGNVERLDPRYDVNDGLHLNPTGYKALADAVDLALFEQFADGVGGFQ
ncbi:hypothetical protein PQX77_020154 [Marasmius sp. AFHP31]|nr:hypothetical protein PQX77_020154 [Marasmius sp. AFHP31]